MFYSSLYCVILSFMFGRSYIYIYIYVMRRVRSCSIPAVSSMYSQALKKKELYPKYLAHKKRNLEAFCPT